MLNIHTRILVHLSQAHAAQSQSGGSSQRRGSNHSPPRMMGRNPAGDVKDEKMDGMEHDSGDILASEPKRKGGLMRAGGEVRYTQNKEISV